MPEKHCTVLKTLTMHWFVVIAVLTFTLTKAIDPSSNCKFGDYDKKKMCFKRSPKNFGLSVRSSPQDFGTIIYIEKALSKNPAVKESLKNRHKKCGTPYVDFTGLTETCPTRLLKATQVRIGKERCYVVRPHAQCATYARCRGRRCAGYLKKPFSSKCLIDGFRYFHVWVYCRSCGFKLVKLKLPQCCSCRKFKICRKPVPG